MSALQRYSRRLRRLLAGNGAELAHGSYVTLLREIQRDERTGELPRTPEDVSADAFLELVAAIGWLRPAREPGEVAADVHRIDADSLAGRYFALPTEIPGFDAIFAGSGPLIIDAPHLGVGSSQTPQPIGGRTVLVIGPYGTGKSTLTLQVAMEAARKGGAALVTALEQSAEECQYAIESLGIPIRSPQEFDTVDEMRDAMRLLSSAQNGRGALAFLPIAPRDSKSAFEAFLAALRERLDWLGAYPLRMLIIDPINSVLDEEPSQSFERRRKLVSVFQEAKRRGVNVWLTCERNTESAEYTPFAENIADTVLQLAVDRDSHLVRRTIEVRKSRLQREEPGRHSLAILPREGIRIDRAFDFPPLS